MKVQKIQAGLYHTADGRFQIESTHRFDSTTGPAEWILREYVNGQAQYWNHYATLADAKAAIVEEMSA